jgi:hypothetical protein
VPVIAPSNGLGVSQPNVLTSGGFLVPCPSIFLGVRCGSMPFCLRRATAHRACYTSDIAQTAPLLLTRSYKTHTKDKPVSKTNPVYHAKCRFFLCVLCGSMSFCLSAKHQFRWLFVSLFLRFFVLRFLKIFLWIYFCVTLFSFCLSACHGEHSFVLGFCPCLMRGKHPVAYPTIFSLCALRLCGAISLCLGIDNRRPVFWTIAHNFVILYGEA